MPGSVKSDRVVYWAALAIGNERISQVSTDGDRSRSRLSEFSPFRFLDFAAKGKRFGVIGIERVWEFGSGEEDFQSINRCSAQFQITYK